MVMSHAIRAGRRRALKRMTDEATIERPTGEFSDPDPETGAVTALYTEIVTEYPFSLRSYEPFERSDDVGGHQATIQRTAARFPVSVAYVPEPKDRLTVTSSDEASLVGRVFLLANTPQNTHTTAYRVYVDEVTS